MEQNEMVKLIADATSQIQSLKDDAELNRKIIVKQEEFLQRLEHAVEIRDKYIVLLESQLRIQDIAINRNI